MQVVQTKAPVTNHNFLQICFLGGGSLKYFFSESRNYNFFDEQNESSVSKFQGLNEVFALFNTSVYLYPLRPPSRRQLRRNALTLKMRTDERTDAKKDQIRRPTRVQLNGRRHEG